MGFFREIAGLAGGRRVWVAELAVAAALGAGAQQAAKTVLVEPPTPLLGFKIGGLTLAQNTTGTAASAVAFDAATCAPTSQGNGETCAAVLKEDGLTRFAAGTYTRASGGAPLPAFALEFGDATGAYSAYTFYRSLEKQPRVTAGDAKTGKSSETTTDAAGDLVWAGTAVLRVFGRPSAKELTALSAMLPKVGGRQGLAPLLPTYLPVKGIEAGTERYALGPVSYKAMGGTMPGDLLAWDKSAEVATADYLGHDGRGVVTLMLYPTPQIAGDRGRALERYVNGAGLAQFGTLKMRRVGPLLGMTTGALSAEQAQAYMAGLHLNQDLSFDKPMPLEFHAEVKKTATLLQSIAAFCGLGLLAALVLGTFLGGARAGIRVLQGKSAASDPEFLTINLRSESRGLFAPKETPGDGRAG
jgi:hypothetical protein